MVSLFAFSSLASLSRRCLVCFRVKVTRPKDKISATHSATSYRTDPESGELKLYDDAEGGQWSRPTVSWITVSCFEERVAFVAVGQEERNGRIKHMIKRITRSKVRASV
jgi:hypothetical protein